MKSIKPKIILAAVLVILLIASLAGCASGNVGIDGGDLTPEDIIEKLYADTDVPPYEIVRLTPENFESFAFVPYDDSFTAASADALVNITPHSVVVIYAANGNGAELADAIIRNADPNKWLCVGAETVNVAYTDHYVVLIMSYETLADAITDNFKSMAKSLDDMEMSLLSADNSRYEQ